MCSAWTNWMESIRTNPTDGIRSADYSGIYGLDGNPWSQSENFNMTPEEVKHAVAVLKAADGGSVKIGSAKYFVLRTETDSLVAKSGEKGLTVALANKCVIIGVYNNHNEIQPGCNYDRVHKVKEQLCNLDY